MGSADTGPPTSPGSAQSCDARDVADMKRLAGGADAALNDLMERHGQRLLHYLVRCLQNEDDAADLAQETFMRVYQHRASFKVNCKFTTWLYTIATNLVKTRYRFRKRHPAVSLDAENPQTGRSLGETIAENRPPPHEQLQGEERVEAVRRAIAALPEDLRVPLLLAEYEDRSQEEIGEILGCSAKAVEMRIYRARQQLRTRLRKLLETA